MIRFIYNLFWPVGLLFFLPGYLVKMFRRGNYRHKFGQRLGCYDVDVGARLARQRSTWLHAVSVGEVAVALKLARQLQSIEPDLHCVLTTTTTTGFSLANRNAPPWIEVMYSPLDFWPIMRRAFAVIRPVRIVLVEAEIWPNLVAEAHARGIPIALVNARLSPRSERRFHWFRFFVAPTFRLLDLVCVPEPEDVDRWSALRVQRSRIHHTGSIKYDPENVDVEPTLPEKVLRDLQIDNPEIIGAREHFRSRPILFGGSTHPGEEEMLAQVFLRLRQRFPSLCLFIAPRHVERVRGIRRQLEALSLSVRLSSQAGSQSEAKPDCVLLDRTGELQFWYGIATVVFIGKSLTARGGQNPVEPIVVGKPVIFGPHMENFATLAKMLVSRNGAIQVCDAGALEQAVDKLLHDKEARRALVENAEQVLMEHRGATARTAALISNLTVAVEGSRSGALQSAE